MTTPPDSAPEPSGADHVPPRRIIFWAIVVIVVLVGIALYFRFSGALSPLAGQIN